MSIRTGLQVGVRALWHHAQLFDVSLKVDGQEFRAHKFLLASVSDYFRLNESLWESKDDVVEVKDVSAERLSRLLDFIYHGRIFNLPNSDDVKMRKDRSLQEGIAALRQDNNFSDITLKVGKQEFRAHKVVLASVSPYFRAMFCGSLKESKNDIVELKEISAEQVSRMLDFIYTADNSLFKRKAKEMLECGVYFQMQIVIEGSKLMLTRSLCLKNCLHLLTTFMKFSLDGAAETVRDYIKGRLGKVLDHYGIGKLLPEVIPVIVSEWKKSEWELYQYLTSWYKADPDNRKIYMDDVMSHVRFKLMTPDEITAVKESRLYTECDGTWKGLVDKAVTYHQLPIHKKVLYKSEQSRVRFAKSVFVMNTSAESHNSSRTYVLCKDEEKKSYWKRYRPAVPPLVPGKYPFVLEVNNFLIVCSVFGENQHWEIFDPRTLTWGKMASMPKAKDGFALVHHGKHLYVLGGCDTKNGRAVRPTDTVQVYDFKTNTWTCTMNTPVAVKDHAACVFNNAIYRCGGIVNRDKGLEVTNRMDCLNISSQKWETKAPALDQMSFHELCVMEINGKQAIVVINSDLSLDAYDPETNQWSHVYIAVIQPAEAYPHPIDTTVKEVKDVNLTAKSSVLTRGNTIYLLRVFGFELSYFDNDGNYVEEGDFFEKTNYCAKWRIPKDPSDPRHPPDILEFMMNDFPIKDPNKRINSVCGMLAFPARSIATKDTKS